MTHAFSRDVGLPDGGVLVLITLDNGRDHTRPNTLGPRSLLELEAALLAAKERAGRGEIAGVAVTGKPFILAAGADLSQVGAVSDRETAKRLGQLGHRVLGLQSDLGVPTFCFINGLTLGGGLEVALNADYRTLDTAAPAIAFPEVFLGLIPGWGGATLLPNLIGIENALKVIVENPLKQNRMLSAQQAFDLGIADVLLPSATFLERSIQWAADVHRRPHQARAAERARHASSGSRSGTSPSASPASSSKSRIGTVPLAPYRALDLLKAAKKATDPKSIAEGFAAEDEALADLISGDQFVASIYAFDLVQKRAKRPAGAPDKKLAKKVTKVGVIGAGLMASQFALLFARRLRVPVLITDLDQARVDAGVERIRGEIAQLQAKGRVSARRGEPARRLDQRHHRSRRLRRLRLGHRGRLRGARRQADGVRERRAAPLPRGRARRRTRRRCRSRRSARSLAHPERVVGFHFFNPVAVMPLVEVVRTPRTDDATLATAMAVAGTLKKNAVIAKDAPGFVVNRILAKVLGEAMHAVDTGTPFEVVDTALDPFGLPMSPFELLDLVGLQVGAHVLDTHHAAFPDRFFESANLHALADAGVLLEKDDKGKRQGLRQAGARAREAVGAEGREADDRGGASGRGSRTASPTRSTGCSRTASWRRPRTSTSA